MLVPRRAHLFAHEVFKSCFAAKDQPAVAGPPRGCFEALVFQKLLPHVFGGCRAEPDFAVLFGGEAERANVGLPVYAGCKIPCRNGVEVFEDSRNSVHDASFLFEGLKGVFSSLSSGYSR